MNKKILLSAIAILSITSLSAMQFQTLGYKAVGMGGASVANSSGSLAAYNNPAMLAKSKYDVEISLGGGVSLQDHGAGDSFKDLGDSNFLDTLDKAKQGGSSLSTLTTTDKNNLIAGKNIILNMDGDAISVAPQAYVGIQIGSFGFGVFGTSEAVVKANVNQQYNELIFDTGTGGYVKLKDDLTIATSSLAEYQSTSITYGVDNNSISASINAIAISEVPIAYGHKFSSNVGNVMVGGSIKYMQGITYTQTTSIDNDNDSNDKVEQTSTAIGTDLGLLYEPSFVKDLRVGLVAKNLNSPSFDASANTTLTVDPLIRLGTAYDVFESLEIAFDVDMTKNETFVPGVDSQMMGGGLNFHPTSWLALRAGAMQNLDSADTAGVIYTAGLGFGSKWLQLDLSLQTESLALQFNEDDYPKYAKVNVALLSRW